MHNRSGDGSNQDDDNQSANKDQNTNDYAQWFQPIKKAYTEKFAAARERDHAENYALVKETKSLQIAKDVISNLRYTHSINTQVAAELRNCLHNILLEKWDIIHLQIYDEVTAKLTAICKEHLKAYSCFNACWRGAWNYIYDLAALEMAIKQYITELAAKKNQNPPKLDHS